MWLPSIAPLHQGKPLLSSPLMTEVRELPTGTLMYFGNNTLTIKRLSVSNILMPSILQTNANCSVVSICGQKPKSDSYSHFYRYTESHNSVILFYLLFKLMANVFQHRLGHSTVSHPILINMLCIISNTLLAANIYLSCEGQGA